MTRERKRSGGTNGVQKTKTESNQIKTSSDPVVVKSSEPNNYSLGERKKLVLWRRPITTCQYFVLELGLTLRDYGRKLVSQRLLLGVMTVLTFVSLVVYHSSGSHQTYVQSFKRQFLWCSWWVGLGVLSSVGLGTGLHTFVLYLGPHIAAVTLAAFECMSVDFPEPPYPDEIVCPSVAGTAMSIWVIMSKLRLEAFMWGAGTAIGELPPYFMARAARLSGQANAEEEEAELMLDENGVAPTLNGAGFVDRAKLVVQRLVHRVGFAGILLCASIPNPLFDLAGITCGHFLVPFWTFFGATLIGKAVVKMHIQKLFVIFVFSQHHVEQLIRLIGSIPSYGASLQAPFKDYLAAQKAKMHRSKDGGDAADLDAGEGGNWLGWFFEKIIFVMVIYFIGSIVHSLAQNYHKRLADAAKTKKAKK